MFSKFFEQAKQAPKRPHRSKDNVPQPRKRPRPNRAKRQPASSKEEALQLSEQILTLTRKKDIDGAMALFWSSVQRDDHHACILIDACAKSGRSMQSDEVQEILSDVAVMTVQTQTALLKGLAMEGDMHRATQLFRSIKRPNIRTLNTVLRGCLWTPATIRKGELLGGVVSADECWRLFSQKHSKELDHSSFDYYVNLQCQALQTERAQAIIDDFCKRFNIQIKGKASVVGGDQSALETLATCYFHMARAQFLLGKAEAVWTACQLGLSAIKGSREALTKATKNPGASTTPMGRGATGGKRGWKDSAQQGRRDQSNFAFRSHRIDETESEIKKLISLRGECARSKLVANQLLRRFVVLSGGGMMRLANHGENTVDQECVLGPRHLLSPLWTSFGLARLRNASQAVDDRFEAELAKASSNMPFLGSHGTLNVNEMFAESSLPMDVELGAGSGDWIQHQAKSLPGRNHIAVELRADRSYHIFTKGHMLGLSNLCVVSSESGLFLDALPENKLSNIFVNFPEPPTQTFGRDMDALKRIEAGGDEPVHMLHSTVLRKGLRCLQPGGLIVIVTDNFSYGCLLCSTLMKVLGQGGDVSSVTPEDLEKGQTSSLQSLERFGEFHLYEGLPDESLGYAKPGSNTSGSSYFDRLWRTGAGSHSERTRRFVVLARCRAVTIQDGK